LRIFEKNNREEIQPVALKERYGSDSRTALLKYLKLSWYPGYPDSLQLRVD
jgi:hypothetical protein